MTNVFRNQSPDIIYEIDVDKYLELGLTNELLIDFFVKMLRIRRFEEMVERLFLVEGKLIGLAHLYFGMEAVAVGVIAALDENDPIISTHRNHGHAIARGVPFRILMAELFGKVTGTCKGLGGSMHAALSVKHHIPLVTAIVGSGIPIACGIGLAIKHKHEKKVATVFFGDGAANTGAFNEGLNLAAIWKLPILFVCENNFYALSTPFYKVCSGENIASRAAAYGIKSFLIPDANDVVTIYVTAKKAIDYIRSDNGPVFMECRTYRKKGHGVYDTGWYRPRDEVEKWLKRDPLDIFREKLKRLNILTDEEIRKMDEEILNELAESVDEAEKAPTLSFEDLWRLVYVSGGESYEKWW